MPKKNKNADLESTVFYLSSILEKTVSFTQHLDTQINILLTICLAGLGFSVAGVGNGQYLISITVLSISFSAAALVALFAIHPPRSYKKRPKVESLMYNKRIFSFSTSDVYERELGKTIGDTKKVVHQYATEIYNLQKYYYRPKRRLFTLSRNILMFGVLLTAIFFFVERLVSSASP